jgi:hypothetical protein
MNKIAAVVSSTAMLAVVLNGGVATADGGGSSSGTWRTDLPLPTNPGTVVSQSQSTAVVRSTDSVAVVRDKLDDLYVTGKGCALHVAVNRPKDYFCYDPATKKTDEIYFTFAALDPTSADPSISQSNAFYVKG